VLATEHDAQICSFDHDFRRFPGLKWSEPAGKDDFRYSAAARRKTTLGFLFRCRLRVTAQ